MSRKPKPNYGDTPTQRTPKGEMIPLPKRGEIMGAFRKIARAKPAKG